MKSPTLQTRMATCLASFANPSYRQFAVADASAAVLWASYVSMLGYLGGETFQDSLWVPLLTTFACAMAVGLGFEAWRRVQKRRGKDILGDELPPEMSAG